MGHRSQVCLALALALLSGCSGTVPAAPGLSSGPSGSAGPSGVLPASSAGQSSVAVDPRLPDFGPVDAGTLEVRLADLEEEIAARVIETGGVGDALGAGALVWLDVFRREAMAETLAGVRLTGAAGQTASAAWPPLLAAEGGSAGLATAVTLVALLGGLDAARPGETGSADMPGVNLTRDTTDGGRRISARITTSVAVRYEGAKVRAAVRVTIDGTISDLASGAALGTISIVSTGNAEVTYCPDAAGSVEGSLDLEIRAGSTLPDAPAPARSLVVSAINGSVNDAAYLAGYRVEGEAEVSATGASAAGGELRVRVGGDVELATPGDIGSAQVRHGSERGSVVRENPPASDANVSALYRQAGSMGGFIAGVIATKAQDKWRGGACVRIDVGGERSRSVGARERVTISARPVHAVEGSELDKPVVASLAGDGQLEPNRTPQLPPATIVYTAGDADGARGTVAIESTSNRGIGRLVLEYTVGQTWDLKVKGRWTSSVSGVVFTGTVSGSVSGVKLGGEARGSPAAGEGVRVTARMTAAGCALTFAPSTATLMVQVSERGDAEVSLRLGVEDEATSPAAGTCPAGTILVQTIAAGGLATFWSLALPEIVVARSGGTTTVTGSRTMGPFPIRATATVTLVPAR